MNSIFFNKFSSDNSIKNKIDETISFLEKFNRFLFITTSNRVSHPDIKQEIPKSSQLAEYIKNNCNKCKIEIIDASKLKIYICEGNISKYDGNNCGVKEASLKDTDKNPDGNLRCWASLNHKDDELWKISKSLFESQGVIFFTSIRWGQANSVYQKIIERLSWIENRNTTLKEKNIVSDIYAGTIALGHNFNGSNVIDLQKNVLKYYGFRTDNRLFWNYQYTQDSKDESKDGYIDDAKKFTKYINLTIKETD